LLWVTKLRKVPADPFVGRVTLNPLVNALWEAHDHALAPLGLTGRQGAMLLSLKYGEANTVAELARQYSLEMSSVTRMLDRLEGKGLVRRERDTADRRKIFIRMTAAGRKKLAEATPVGAAVANRAWGNVTAAERAVLHRVLAKVRRNISLMA
jgi:DNA-binding MarR family transcriptional regulator